MCEFIFCSVQKKEQKSVRIKNSKITLFSIFCNYFFELNLIMLKTIINLHKRSFSQIAFRQFNPYLIMPPNQLQQLIKYKMLQKAQKIQDLNDLIKLGVASQKNKISVSHLLNKCVQNLETIQQSINEQTQDELSNFLFDDLVQVFSNQKENFLASTQGEKLGYLYLNTYSNFLSLSKQLKIYQYSLQNPVLDLIKDFSSFKISNLMQNQRLSLSEYLTFLKLFYHEISIESINKKIKEYENFESLRQITEPQKLSLYYIVMIKNGNLHQIEKLGLNPNLEILSKQNQKSTCIKLQILNKRKQLQPIKLEAIKIQNWDFIHLVWLSQFTGKNLPLQHKIHQKIISSPFSSLCSISLILTYIQNSQISSSQHKQISKWLCKISQKQQQDDLCKILLYINQKKLQSLYEDFHLKVLEMSLGNFKWESQNIVYFCGSENNIKNDNMEYLRRYILNTYASFGTARRQIPTTSYFYKILQITSTQNFYGNL